ncbi:glutathione S-transferase [Biscogniauxia marginata]|nr:glutathione S-transferase [Biscogniauxia marginata]
MDKLYVSDTPVEVKTAKALHLLTANTGNGQAVQIFLEELAEAYGLSWTTTLVDVWSNEQKKEWFLRLNPNGRIPVVIDNRHNPPVTVHESSAALIYLLKNADKEKKFGFEDELENNELLQWLFFWHGSGAPYQGQLIHFTKAAPEKIEYAIARFRDETLRVFGVLEIRLSGKYTGEPRDYLAGRGKGKYSIADIKTWPWVSHWEICGITEQEMKAFPHLLNWIGRIARRPAVQTGTGSKYNPGGA